MPNTRTAVTLAVAALVIGVAVVVVAVTINTPTSHRYGKVGVLTTALAIPGFIAAYSRRTQTINNDERARIKLEGWYQGYEYGLNERDQPGPNPGTHVDDTAWGGYADQSHRSNVVPLRRIPRYERQAQ